MKMRVLVLGGSGMLGSMVVDQLSSDPNLQVTATARTQALAAAGKQRVKAADWQTFDAAVLGSDGVPGLFQGCEWVINCIGIIKPLIHDDNSAEVERAIRVNSLFPHLLARWTEGSARVVQIATDCVYSGVKGSYAEDDNHDALDVYGKTKSLGEVHASHVHHLRCSIIGPEIQAPKSLLEWFLGQPPGASVNGFLNHNWNGVTTLHYAKLCAGIIRENPELPHLQHVIPDGEVTKYDMLQLFARQFDRSDITVKPIEAPTVVNRTLSTAFKTSNSQLWSAAGYAKPPSVPEMIEELVRLNHMFSGKTLRAQPV